jgi:hypothetical protein
LISLIGGFYFDSLTLLFYMTSFYRIGQKYKNIFVRFFSANEKLKKSFSRGNNMKI